MLGDLYPAGNLVRWALRPRTNRRPNILDIGTGSGRWYVQVLNREPMLQLMIPFRVIDMAKEFPHCDVVGVDLAPPRLEG